MPVQDTGSDYGTSTWVPSGFAGWGNELNSASAAWGAAISGDFYQNAANSMGNTVVSPGGQTYNPDSGIAELPLFTSANSWMAQLAPEAQQNVDTSLYGDLSDLTTPETGVLFAGNDPVADFYIAVSSLTTPDTLVINTVSGIGASRSWIEGNPAVPEACFQGDFVGWDPALNGFGYYSQYSVAAPNPVSNQSWWEGFFGSINEYIQTFQGQQPQPDNSNPGNAGPSG